MTDLLDTNIALYLLQGRLARPLPAARYGISVISEIEMLAWPSLMPEEERAIRAFIADVTVCDLSREVRGRTVRIRRETGLKLPDAVICATALVWGATLWSNDTRFRRVADLVLKTVPILP
jgi:predicted nucleic acid-binding protein